MKKELAVERHIIHNIEAKVRESILKHAVNKDNKVQLENFVKEVIVKLNWEIGIEEYDEMPGDDKYEEYRSILHNKILKAIENISL